jgi:plastocyanin
MVTSVRPILLVLLVAACGPRDVIPNAPNHPANPGAPQAASPPAEVPSHDEHVHQEPAPAPAEQPVDDKETIAAAEKAAYEKARPVFEKFCAKCHSASGAKKTKKKLDHFSIDAYPFGGHHADAAGKTVREVLGVDGGKATMPADQPGAVEGAELEAVVEWSRAFDRAHEAGLHPAAEKPHDHGAARPVKRRVAITISAKGFGPDKIKVKKGESVTLAFTRKTDKTCAKQVILQLGGGKSVEKELPLDKTVVIEATFETAGELRYACSMDMYTGVVVVQP